MRATSVVSEGPYRLQYALSPKGRSGGAFSHWDEKCQARDFGGAQKVSNKKKLTAACPPPEPVLGQGVKPALKQQHRRTRIDLLDDGDDANLQPWRSWLRETWTDTLGSSARLQLMLTLTKTDASARKGAYLLSFCSVCTVVFVCVIMISILSTFAIVGLRLAEASHGPLDLVLSAGGAASRAASLNYTRIAARADQLPEAYRGHAYRIAVRARATTAAECALPNGTIQSLWYKPAAPGANDDNSGCFAAQSNSPSNACVLCQRTCMSAYCHGNSEDIHIAVIGATNAATPLSEQASAVAAVVDRLPHGSVAISASLLGALKLEVGDTVLATTEIHETLRHAFGQVRDPFFSNPRALFAFRVGAVVNDALYTDASGDFYVLVPPRDFSGLLADALAPSFSADDRERVRSTTPAEYATSVTFQMPEAMRNRVYVQSTYASIRASVWGWGKVVTRAVGANQITERTPLLAYLKTMEYFNSFVGLIISVVVLALSLLSILLIYTLLSIGVETKTYEMGIQRMIGFRRLHLVMLVFTNTYFFALPAWVFGLVAGQLGYWIVRGVVLQLAAIPLHPMVSASAVGWATLVGLGVPFLAAILPLYALIAMSLPKALDTARGRSTGVLYSTQRGRSRQADALMFGLGFLGALAGMCLYVFFPNSLLAMNLPVLFLMTFGVLLGMLGGLVLLATNLQRVVETALRGVLLFWESPAVQSMVGKSLAAHRVRNRQSTLMYSLSVGFVVFVTVAFQIEVLSLEYSTLRQRGADISVYMPAGRRPEMGVTPGYAQQRSIGSDGVAYAYEQTSVHAENEMGIRGQGIAVYYEDLIQLQHDVRAVLGDEVVTGLTYRMASLDGSSVWPQRSVRMRTIGRSQSFVPSVNSVPPNLYDVVNSHFVIVDSYDDSVGRYGLAGALYSRKGQHKAIVATTTNRVFALENSSSLFVWETTATVVRRTTNASGAVTMVPRTQTVLSGGTVAAVMDSSPLFLMTKFPNSMGEVLIGLPAAARQTSIPYLSCNVMSVRALFLRVRSPDDYDAVKTFVRQWLSARNIANSMDDLTDSLSDVRTTKKIFSVFFVVTQIMIMLICLFSLMSSMSANVLESSKEVGVLLCLGMSHLQVYRVYIWEAFLLVFASGLLGLLMGTAVATTMLMQSALFTQLYVPFPFPTVQFAIVVVMGVASALAASLSPVRYLLHQPSITHILRRIM